MSENCFQRGVNVKLSLATQKVQISRLSAYLLLCLFLLGDSFAALLFVLSAVALRVELLFLQCCYWCMNVQDV